MQTTITEFKPTNCPRCAGAGRLSAFQHVKGGECFRCGGTGLGDGEMVQREMEDHEVIAALKAAGIEFMPTESDDWLDAMFAAYTPEAMAVARNMLSLI